jgi:hypothetical protein
MNFFKKKFKKNLNSKEVSVYKELCSDLYNLTKNKVCSNF